jgi:hypothetical protein
MISHEECTPHSTAVGVGWIDHVKASLTEGSPTMTMSSSTRSAPLHTRESLLRGTGYDRGLRGPPAIPPLLTPGFYRLQHLVCPFVAGV